MKDQKEAEQGIELSTNCVQLKIIAEDGKLRETDCANTQSLFRIIQSVPSPKANQTITLDNLPCPVLLFSENSSHFPHWTREREVYIEVLS